MNKKLIAAAVSAAVMAPVASQADTTVYGRINNAIDLNALSGADDAEGKTDISGISSRFGIKASADLDNGMTANGRYEFSTTTDKEGGGVEDTRLASVGLSGSFGSVNIGNQWSAYFDTFGTLVSPTYTLGYYLYSSVGGGPYRTSNTIKYANTFGPVYLELDYRLNGSDEGSGVAEKIRGDGYGLGVSFSVTDSITVAVAIDSENDADDDGPTTDRTGVGINAKFGGYWVNFGFQNYGVDDDAHRGRDEVDIATNFLYVGGSLGEKTGWLIGTSGADDDVAAVESVAEVPAAADGSTELIPAVEAAEAIDASSQFTWGVYHNLGNGLRLYYEGTSVVNGNRKDSDGNPATYDGTRQLLGMRFDF